MSVKKLWYTAGFEPVTHTGSTTRFWYKVFGSGG